MKNRTIYFNENTIRAQPISIFRFHVKSGIPIGTPDTGTIPPKSRRLFVFPGDSSVSLATQPFLEPVKEFDTSAYVIEYSILDVGIFDPV